MKNPIIGEKVKVYSVFPPYIGTIISVNRCGVVTVSISTRGFDSKENIRIEHTKACRRLKKKERRVVWIAELTNGLSNFNCLHKPKPGSPEKHFKRWVRFVECKERGE